MGWTMRVSLPGYNALTDGTIDHYSIYADTDNILIKEKQRGTVAVGFGTTSPTVTHNLGYVPLALCWVNNGGTMQFLSGNDAGAAFSQSFSIGTQNITLNNNTSGTYTFNYFIFYDQGTAL